MPCLASRPSSRPCHVSHMARMVATGITGRTTQVSQAVLHRVMALLLLDKTLLHLGGECAGASELSHTPARDAQHTLPQVP